MSKIEQNWIIYLCLIGLCLQFIGHPFFVDYYRHNPLNIPISLYPMEEIVERIEIRMPQRYELEFSFAREDHEFEKLIKLIGGIRPENRTGTTIPVKWSLTHVNSGFIVFENQVQTNGARSFSAKEIGRFIGYIEVSPGLYTLKLEILRPVLELQGIKTRLKVSYEGCCEKQRITQ